MSLTDVDNVCAAAINQKGDIFAAILGKGIFLSSDNGHTWAPANNGLPALDVSKLIINSKDHIFAVADPTGLFRSLDDGHTWSKVFPLDLSSSNQVTSIAVNADGDLFLGVSSHHHPQGLSKSANDDYNSDVIKENCPANALAINSQENIFLADSDNGSYNQGTQILVSRNNGATWNETVKIPNYLISSFDFNNKGHIIARCSHNVKGAYRSLDNGVSWAWVAGRFPYPEGGHLETDFNTTFFSEWWYLNGRVDLIGPGGERRELGFLFIISHEESSVFKFHDEQLSWIIHLHAIYLQDGCNKLELRPICVPRRMLKKFMAIHTPYVLIRHPDDTSVLVGSAKMGYSLHLAAQAYQIDCTFHPRAANTLDHSSRPIDFYAFERSFGSISGQVILSGKTYRIVNGEGYFDHMLAFEDDTAEPWATCFHGWSWAEVTTEKFQVVIYALRSLADGYGAYSYKKVTLLDKQSGKIIVVYEGNDVTIMETQWIEESAFNRKRPERVDYLADNLKIRIDGQNVVVFDHSDPKNFNGFVDFMAHKGSGARVEYEGKAQKGTAFYEYLVTDMGAKRDNPSQKVE